MAAAAWQGLRGLGHTAHRDSLSVWPASIFPLSSVDLVASSCLNSIHPPWAVSLHNKQPPTIHPLDLQIHPPKASQSTPLRTHWDPKSQLRDLSRNLGVPLPRAWSRTGVSTEWAHPHSHLPEKTNSGQDLEQEKHSFVACGNTKWYHHVET